MGMPVKTDRPIGSGISYYEVEDLVERIVSMKKSKYQYPGHEPEDLAQDIRLIALEALKHFDSEKLGKSVFHFVARCVDNGLYNKFRGVYLNNNPPCLRCPEYIKETRSCAIDEVGCDRIISYRERMAKRRAIAAPLSYNANLESEEEGDYSHQEGLAVGSTTGVCDLDDTLRASIDPGLLSYYEMIVAGNSDAVPAHIKKQIQRQVREAMDRDV